MTDMEIALREARAVARGFEKRAEAAEAGLALAESMRRAAITAVLYEVQGTVEGHPTSAINYLQRLRALVATEQRAQGLEARLAQFRDVLEEVRDIDVTPGEDPAATWRAAVKYLQEIARAALTDTGGEG